MPRPTRSSPMSGGRCRSATVVGRRARPTSSPRATAPEFARVLRPDGVLVVVTPAADHLAELVDAARPVAGRSGEVGTGWPTASTRCSTGRRPGRTSGSWSLTATDVGTLVGMGPSAWHAKPARCPGRIAALPDAGAGHGLGARRRLPAARMTVQVDRVDLFPADRPRRGTGHANTTAHSSAHRRWPIALESISPGNG